MPYRSGAGTIVHLPTTKQAEQFFVKRIFNRGKNSFPRIIYSITNSFSQNFLNINVSYNIVFF